MHKFFLDWDMSIAEPRLHYASSAPSEPLSHHAAKDFKLSEHDLKNRQVIEQALAHPHARIPTQFQSRFHDYLYRYHHQHLRQIHLLAQLAFLLYFFADFFILPDLILVSGLSRVAIVLAIWLLCKLMFSATQDIQLLDLILPVGTTLCAGIWIILLLSSNSPHVANYLYASAIFILIVNLSIKLQFKVSLYCSIFICLFVLIAMRQIMTLSETFVFMVVISPVLLFSLYMNWNNIQNMRREFLRSLLDEWNYYTVRKLAHTDELTQLYNRRHFVDLAEHSIHEWPKSASTCLLMFDVDHFKQVNDNYGHDIGDRVLQLIAATTRKEMRHSDVLARFGGEEFIVLLSDTQLQDALLIAERIRYSIQRQSLNLSPELNLKFTVSIGITELQSPSQSLAELIKQVDLALYAAKRSGRNRVRVYSADLMQEHSPHSANLHDAGHVKTGYSL